MEKTVLTNRAEDATIDLLHGTCALSFATPSCAGLARRSALNQTSEMVPQRTWHVVGSFPRILVGHATADTDSEVESFA